MPDRDLCTLTIAELGPLLQRRELSAVQVTRAYLERIQRIDPVVNSFITVAGERALAEAEAADRAISAGEYRGPLHGVPLAIKDLFCTQGLRTTAGSKILMHYVPDRDATVVARLRAAGAVLLGKLNMHEYAYGVTNVNPHFGPVRNPWDRDRISGGSSGGSAAAVAADLCAGSLGTATARSMHSKSG